MSPAIVVEGLSKTYYRRKRAAGVLAGLRAYFSVAQEEVHAVRELDFRIEAGESVGLIGENGAGKSSVVKMLTGILVPSRGEARTLGLNPWRERRRLARNIGVVFGQKPQLLWDIPAGESFKLLKGMYAIPDDVYRYTYGEAVERLELAELLKTPVRLLSLGQRMRCDLAAALLHAPLVAFLDEPTIGLDVLVKERVREFLREIRRRFGTTLLLTTHDLKDITATCDRLIVLDKGRRLYDGDLRGFQDKFASERSLLAELSDAPSTERRGELERVLAGHAARTTWESPLRVRVDFPNNGVTPRVTGLLLEHLSVQDLALQGTELDTIVAQLYKQASAT
ncbi:MAG TPA: ATP-binding cassette domain-containing protein [Polyangiaceae bacterium]|jgi:ABC-2 type transport system ATP-binding protein